MVLAEMLRERMVASSRVKPGRGMAANSSPDNDQSFNFLVSLLYAQAFQALYYSADQIHHGTLPCHVHFILDTELCHYYPELSPNCP